MVVESPVPASQGSAPDQDEGAIFDELTDLLDLVNTGDPGLVALQRVVAIVPAVAGGTGAGFVEFGATGSRVVAASGELEPLLGRPIATAAPTIARLLDGPGVREFDRVEMGTRCDRQAAASGFRRLVRATAASGDRPVGVLVVGYPEDAGALRPAQRSALRLLATLAAHLYAVGRHLPVHPDSPAPAGYGQGYATIGADRVVRTWNAAAALLTGYPADEVIGRPWPLPLPEGDDVVEHRTPGGRWLEIRSGAVPGAGDTLAVSLLPRSEPAPPDEDRDLFIAVTSHELRTPVTVIRGYADTLAEHWDALDEAARISAVSVIRQRARGLARVLDRLLLAAGDGIGPAEPAVGVPFDLAEAVREAVDELSEESRRDLRVALPAGLPKALGDRGGLATIVTELVTNACKYSPNGGEVELTAGADAQAVWLRVADRGVGIRPEHVERAFERFWQLQTGDQRRLGGVGLGLYLVRRVVERQRGWVSLRPRPGGGTVAEVRLPRADMNPPVGTAPPAN